MLIFVRLASYSVSAWQAIWCYMRMGLVCLRLRVPLAKQRQKGQRIDQFAAKFKRLAWPVRPRSAKTEPFSDYLRLAPKRAFVSDH